MKLTNIKRRVIKITNPILFPVVRTWWLIRPHAMNGVKVILHTPTALLLVKHSFGSNTWKLPGGQIKSGENPLKAAQRELMEELGVKFITLQEHGIVEHTTRRYHDTVRVFSTQIPQETTFLLGPEIEATRWVNRENIPYSEMSEMTCKAVTVWQNLTRA